ncbi:MAG: S-layer homology domain-containing protein, partial [Clostridia bacterium]|nr:S-layer homology domain-containing protein [Clostridia bacterium]
MRNMKKFLALVLAMMMMLSVAVFNTSAAEEEADYTNAALFLNSLAVMQGSTDGDLMLDAGVERYQAALFFARCLTGKTETEIWNGTPASAYFTDVTMYGTAIDYAYGMGVVKGRGGNTFGATDKIIYQDMIVMAVRALGYETENMSYPWGHIIAAEKLDLLEDIDNVNYKAVMTRGEVAQLLENTLKAQIARIDPVSKAPLYVDDTNSLGATITEVATNTLLNKAGFVDSEAVNVTFVES